MPGHCCRTGIDMIEVESVDVVEPSSVDAAQAREAGYTSVGELLADLRGDPALPVYRIRLRRMDGPDPRDELVMSSSFPGRCATARRPAHLRSGFPLSPTSAAWGIVALQISVS